MPAISVPARVDVVLQNISGSEMIYSDLVNMRLSPLFSVWWMTYLFPVIPADGCIGLIWDEVKRAN